MFAHSIWPSIINLKSSLDDLHPIPRLTGLPFPFCQYLLCIPWSSWQSHYKWASEESSSSWTNWKVSPININSQGMRQRSCHYSFVARDWPNMNTKLASSIRSSIASFLPPPPLVISPRFIALTCTKSADGGKFTDFCFNKSGLPFRTRPARNGTARICRWQTQSLQNGSQRSALIHRPGNCSAHSSPGGC